MEKGSGICHGTAGNGHAFLKVFERTGDELWLDRARRFAVTRSARSSGAGPGRYSLWTGDVGVALYAADCIDGVEQVPRARVLGLGAYGWMRQSSPSNELETHASPPLSAIASGSFPTRTSSALRSWPGR